MVKSVLIVEDHALTRQAVCSLFASQEDFEVCGDAENGQEAVEIAQVLRPDLIVLDLSMPVMNGIEAAQALKQLMPETPIIVFSEYCDVFSEREARSEGISALVSKTEPVSVLLDNARAVLDYTAGGFLSPSNQRKEHGHVHTRS
jgi:DNA-binding NarL/FixJ family response regulator